MRAADADGDGRLSSAELVKALHGFYERCAQDSNGRVTRESLAAALAGILPAAYSAQAGAGVERSSCQPRLPQLSDELARSIFTEADPEQIGRVSLDRLIAAALLAFRDCDHQCRDALDAEELIEAVRCLPMP